MANKIKYETSSNIVVAMQLKMMAVDVVKQQPKVT